MEHPDLQHNELFENQDVPAFMNRNQPMFNGQQPFESWLCRCS